MSKFKFEVATENKTDYGTLFTVKISAVGEKVLVNNAPFGNCQNFSIGYFGTLIDYPSYRENIYEIIKEIKEVCKFSKPFLILDLSQYDYKLIKDKLKIVSATPYENANMSEMVLLIVDTRVNPKS